MATDGDGHRATSDRTCCQDFVEVIIINYPFSRYSSEFLTSGTEAWQHPGDSLRYHVSIYMFCGSWWFLVVLGGSMKKCPGIRSAPNFTNRPGRSSRSPSSSGGGGFRSSIVRFLGGAWR